MSRDQESVEICYDEIVTDTDLAILFDDGDSQFWIPKSVIEDHDEDDKIVTVKGWFAEQEGLI